MRKKWDKLLALLDETINKTVHKLIKIAVFIRFLSDEKKITNYFFSVLI